MKYTIENAIQNLGKWVKGTEDFDGKRELSFCVKVYDLPSEDYGLNGGKISKLEIRLGNEILAHYSRGWDIEVAEEARELYGMILAEFN